MLRTNVPHKNELSPEEIERRQVAIRMATKTMLLLQEGTFPGHKCKELSAVFDWLSEVIATNDFNTTK